MSLISLLDETLSLPSDLMALLPCHWQTDARFLWALFLATALVWLVLWITRSLVPAGPQQSTRQWQDTAIVAGSALAGLGVLLGQFAQLSQDLPAPMLLAIQGRWLALVPLVLWLVGLLNPAWRNSMTWSRLWTRVAALSSVLLMFVMQLSFFRLGCII